MFNNTSTPIRLFGQFKPNSNGFSNFRQLSSNGDDSSPATTTITTSYFTNTLSQFSSTNTRGGFGSSSTSLAASLAPLNSKYEIPLSLISIQNIFFFSKPLFGESNSSTKKEDDANEEENDDEEPVEDDEDEANKSKPSLLETAAEYEAKRASTHPAATIQGDTSTGEEHEVTKFQVRKSFPKKNQIFHRTIF